jgi:hypothetical protein
MLLLTIRGAVPGNGGRLKKSTDDLLREDLAEIKL